MDDAEETEQVPSHKALFNLMEENFTSLLALTQVEWAPHSSPNRLATSVAESV